MLLICCNWYIRVFLIALAFFWSKRAKWVKEDKLSMYFGVPGSGKTTFAAWYSKQALAAGVPVYSNVPIKGTYKVERSDIGKYLIQDCLLIIDEASLEYNNRDFKNFAAQENKFYSLHRHYCVECIFFSQDWEDEDKRIRTLAQRLYYVKRSLIPGFIVRKEIKKTIDISQDKQIIDGYNFVPLSARWIYCRPLWKLFDSFDAPELPEKEWKQWSFEAQKEALPEASEPPLSVQQSKCQSEEAQTKTNTMNLQNVIDILKAMVADGKVCDEDEVRMVISILEKLPEFDLPYVSEMPKKQWEKWG